jgi:hypothetical protein
VVRDKYPDSLLFEIENNLADVIDCKWIDTGERFVEENILRFGSEAASDLDPPAFASRKSITADLADVLDTEFLK